MAELRSSKTKEELIKDFRTHEILEAARQVIENVGVSEASMERIAQRAGISKGTIYLYFKNRESLIIEVVAHSFLGLMQTSRAATQNTETASAKLAALIGTGLRYSAEHRAMFQELAERAVRGASGASAIDDQFDRQADEFVQFIAEIVDEGIASGEFRRVPSLRIARFITEGMRGVVRERFRGTAPPHAEQEAKDLVQFFLRGIAAGEQ